MWRNLLVLKLFPSGFEDKRLPALGRRINRSEVLSAPIRDKIHKKNSFLSHHKSCCRILDNLKASIKKCNHFCLKVTNA